MSVILIIVGILFIAIGVIGLMYIVPMIDPDPEGLEDFIDL